MNNNIIIELFGYLGTILVVVSMMMTSITKLRIVNMSGSVISAIYAGICGTWPIVLMNVCLFIINGFHLIRESRANATGNAAKDQQSETQKSDITQSATE